VSNRVRALPEDRGLHRGDRRKAERVAENRQDEALGDGLRVGLHLSARLEVRPVRLGDAPVAADLVAQVESLGDAIVGFYLGARLKLGNLGEPLRRE
jgi:hypothetical protein